MFKHISGGQTLVKYCTVDLTEEKYQAFVYAVKNHYWYQMYIDDLPIWGKWWPCQTCQHILINRRQHNLEFQQIFQRSTDLRKITLRFMSQYTPEPKKKSLLNLLKSFIPDVSTSLLNQN